LKDIDEATAQAKKKNSPKGKQEAKSETRAPEKSAEKKPDPKSTEAKLGDPKPVDLKPVELKPDEARNEGDSDEEHRGRSMVTGVRHWSTPDYTRIAIDLENEVKYSSDRIANPSRIYFDLKDTRLSSILKGKTFDVDDGYLKKIRVAQFAPGLTRVVLEVGEDVSEYSAFLLPNPYRLVIDIHGKRPATLVAHTPVTAEPKKAEKIPTTDEVLNAKLEPPAKAEPRSSTNAPSKAANEKIAESKLSRKPVDTLPVAHPAPAELTPASVESKPITKPAEVKKVVVQPDPLPAPDVAKTDSQKSDSQKIDSPKTEVAKLTPPVTAEQPAPRSRKRTQTKVTEAKIHEAQPTSDGDRSLIRALGLKIGRIVIDAGHGGHDTGTIGPNGMREKDLVLDVALKLGKLLEDRLGAEVVYTRDDDTFIPLETRTAIANQQQADLFISIHANSSDDASARGVETYYLNFTSSRDALEVAARENAVSEKSIHELQDLVKKIALKEKIEESRELAVDIQQSLHTGLAAKTPAIRDRGVKKAPFIVLIGANMPSILAEISFISNPSDEKKLQTSEYRQKIADSLYKGISKYVGGLSGIKVAAKMANEPGD
jgi:N-acetylmuramoyl-L-alanine amidase